MENGSKPGYSRVEAWISRQAEGTRKPYRFMFKDFMEWIGQTNTKFRDATPDELVEHQFNADRNTRYDILDQLVQPYLLTVEGRLGYKQKIYTTIRSFFMHSRAELPKDPGINLAATRESVRGNLEAAQVRDIVLSSKPVYQAVILSMTQGGMGLAELHYWSRNGWASLKEQLNEDRPIIKIELPGRLKSKKRRPYHTYVSGDAVAAIKNYLQYRPPGAGEIFANQVGQPIIKSNIYMYWLRHLRRIGLVPPAEPGKLHTRTGRNPHELRDLFRTQWAKSGASPDVAEYMMGHDIDANDYNKCFTDEEYTLQEYRRALPYLQIMTGTAPYRLVRESKVEELQQELERLKQTKSDEVAELRELLLGVLNNPEALNEARRRLARET